MFPREVCSDFIKVAVFGHKKGRPRAALDVRLVEAAGITSPYKTIAYIAKCQKCPHRYPQIVSADSMTGFWPISSLLRRSPCVEPLQRIGAADRARARRSRSIVRSRCSSGRSCARRSAVSGLGIYSLDGSDSLNQRIRCHRHRIGYGRHDHSGRAGPIQT